MHIVSLKGFNEVVFIAVINYVQLCIFYAARCLLITCSQRQITQSTYLVAAVCQVLPVFR